MRRAALVAACALLACASVFTRAQAQQRETISFESRQKGQPVQVAAEITWPANTGASPVPAMVIHHGSGGVGEREARYVRELVPMGVATVMIDSFKPRGVTSTVLDQSAVTGQDFNLDALVALKALAANPRIDRRRIGIIGFSKGGTSALMASHEQLILAAGGTPGGPRYALHVPFYPSCTAQYYQPRTTGAPIYQLLGGADTYCRLRAVPDLRRRRWAPRAPRSRPRSFPARCTASTMARPIPIRAARTTRSASTSSNPTAPGSCVTAAS